MISESTTEEPRRTKFTTAELARIYVSEHLGEAHYGAVNWDDEHLAFFGNRGLEEGMLTLVRESLPDYFCEEVDFSCKDKSGTWVLIAKSLHEDRMLDEDLLEDCQCLIWKALLAFLRDSEDDRTFELIQMMIQRPIADDLLSDLEQPVCTYNSKWNIPPRRVHI